MYYNLLRYYPRYPSAFKLGKFNEIIDKILNFINFILLKVNIYKNYNKNSNKLLTQIE